MKKKFTFLMAALMLLTMMVLPGKVWADSETITCSSGSPYFTGTHFTISYGKNSGTDPAYNAGDQGLRLYANNYLTITPNNGETITAVTLSVKCNKNKNNVYPTSITVNTGSITAGSTPGESVTSVVWSGETTTGLTFTVNGTAGNVAVKSIAITYTPATPAYTITAQSNNTDYGTVELSGSVITGAPKTGYRYASPAYTVTSGNATVSQNGNEFTVTPSSDCTVRINFEAIPTHTATFSVNGTTSTQNFAEGATITFPANPANIGDKAFVGWVTTAIEGTTNSDPGCVTSATMGNSDVTYYAVFGDLTTTYSETETEISQTHQYDTWTYSGTTTDKTNYRLFAEDAYIESTTFDLSILKEVDVYAGTFGTLDNSDKIVTVKAGTTTWGTASLSTNSATTQNEITSSVSLSGNGQLHIVAGGGDGSTNGIRISKVEIITKKATTTIANYCTTVTSASTWTVTYDGNGKTSGTVPVDATVYDADNNTVTVLGNTGNLEKTGHTWNGWNTEADYTGDSYTENEQFTISESTTLYAQWMINSYSYTLNVIGDDAGALAELEVDGSTVGATIQYGKEVEVVVVTNTGYNYSISVKDANNNDIAVANDKFTMPASNVTVTVTTNEASTYTLVTSTNQLVPGKHYLIASGKTGSVNVMGHQKSNNRNAVSVTVDDNDEISVVSNVINTENNVYEFVISGYGDDHWTIYDEATKGYLYAASSGSNYLKTQATNDDNGTWRITINDSNVASIVAQGNNTRNVMQFNANLFACYNAASYDDVYLFVKEFDNDCHIYSPTILSSTNKITVPANGVLTVDGNNLTNTDPANLIIEDGGQLIVNNSGVQATFQKNITGYDTSKDDDNPYNDGYKLIANPTIGGVAPSSVTGMLANDDYDLYYFKEAEDGYEWRNYRKETFTIDNGIGYLYAKPEDITLNFIGEVPTETSKSNISLSYTAGNAFAGFNLMGNPLSVNITSMKINTTSCGYYKLNNDGTFTGVTDVASEPVVVGQGFMVEASANTDKLHLNPTAKDEESFSNESIRLEVANSKYTDVAYICFGNMLPLTKINHMNDGAPMIYIHNESADNAVAVYNNRGEVKSVDVNFEAKTTGTYNISAKMMKGEVKYMHLYDRLTGIDTDLLMDDYSFIGAKGDITGRFILNLESVDNNSSIGSDTFAYQSGNDIIVNGEGTLEVYDVTGRKVMATTINGVETINGLNSGVYIFRIIGETLRTQKIVVR